MSIMTRRRHREPHPTLTADDIWAAVSKATFAVISHVTPAGAPRSSGVVYAVAGDRMYVVVAKNSWKARHIRENGDIAVTVPVRRGGLLSLLAPIPPAVVSFPAVATVQPPEYADRVPQLDRLLPPVERSECAVLEIRPTGAYVTYGLGVPLLAMRDTERARARVPVR
ncbi:pyridoxamine 5'-phosphate oxidase family protein [Actinoplanes sp. NPDC049802]|uniref:pyridoxamine 5'-phosphate oxidase family protein n=1 Tax=Actinoplanes sp. NPDC049802 TaxID=3154742 RepID=UPI0033E8340C